MKDHDRPFKRCSDTELEAFVTRVERVLQAGTSTHADLVELVDAEGEIMYREAKALRRTVHEERHARTVSNATSEGWLSIGSKAERDLSADRAR